MPALHAQLPGDLFLVLFASNRRCGVSQTNTKFVN